jgi:hypothetical protein
MLRCLTLLYVLVLCVSTGVAHAEETRELSLEAAGGVKFKAPNWRNVRKDNAVVVLERGPDFSDPKRPTPLNVLVVSIEEGPSASPVSWEKIRDNIVAASSRNGRALTLESGENASDLQGFEARWFSGEFTGSNGKKVGMALLALVKDKRLVTVGLVSEQVGDSEKGIVSEVARSVRLGP